MPKANNEITITKAILLLNKQTGPTIFHDDISRSEVTWEGHGDPMGRDIQAIPASYLENVNFLRILNKGVLEVFDAPPEVLKLITAQLDNPVLKRQRDQYEGSVETQATAVRSQLGPSVRQGGGTDGDYTTGKCIGPNSRGNGKCGEDIVRGAGQNSPPLCTAHQALKPLCVEVETEEVVDGKVKTIWTLAKLETASK